MAVRFDAAADRLSHSDSYPQTSAGITVTAWARVDVDRNDWSTITRLNQGGNTVVTFGMDSDGLLGPQVFTPIGSAQFGSGSFTVGTWYPVAFTRSASTGDITTWRQLTSGATTTATVNLATTDLTATPSEICIGGRSSSDATEWLNGSVAYFRVWSAELTQAEIEAEWASTTPVRTSNLHSNFELPQAGDYLDRVASKLLVTQSGGQPTTANGPLFPAKNLCPNPCADVDLTGWSGSLVTVPGTNVQTGVPTRTTGLLAAGFPKDTGFKYGIAPGSAGYLRSMPALVTAGQSYTVSIWGSSPDLASATAKLQTTYLVWYNADGSDNAYNNFGAFHSAGSVSGLAYRKIMTGTAPAGAVAVGVIIDGGTDCVLSLLQVEEGTVIHDYADGDTPGWQWDGTAGKSSSQPTVTGGGSTTGVVAGSLPAPSGSLAGNVRSSGAFAGALPSLTGALSGGISTSGALAGQLPGLGGSLAGILPSTTGELAGALPALGGTLTGSLRASGLISGELPAFSGALTGLIASPGLVQGSLPTLGGSLNDIVTLLTQDPYALEVQRENTRAFIAADPFSVTLRTRTDVRTATGGRIMTDGSFRSPQIGKLIMMSPAGGSIEQRTQDGTERQVDFILLLEWDAEIEVGDWWDDQQGNRWEVKAMIPTNNYEIRAVVEAHGKQMTGG